MNCHKPIPITKLVEVLEQLNRELKTYNLERDLNLALRRSTENRKTKWKKN